MNLAVLGPSCPALRTVSNNVHCLSHPVNGFTASATWTKTDFSPLVKQKQGHFGVRVLELNLSPIRE